MIAECYTMDVYCDVCSWLPDEEWKRTGYTGKNKRECDKQRVADGWKKKKGQDVCPKCALKGGE